MSELTPEPLRRRAPPATMSAWQRWEMTSITSTPAAIDAPAAASADAPLLAPASSTGGSTMVIDEDELIRLRLQAQQAGQAEGRKEGFAIGKTEGYAAGLALAKAQAQALQALLVALPQAMRTAETEVAEDLLALAIDIAQQVVSQTLASEPQHMLALVRDLLRMEPVLSGTPRLLMHADDVALVQQHLADELTAAGWRIRTDPTIQRGGCRVHAASGALDATLETRWERVTAAFQHKPDKPKKIPKPRKLKEVGHV
jgi:flagellar assembly protein FliH